MRKKIKRGWISIPCTAWSSIQNLNAKKPQVMRKVKKARRLSKKMLRRVLRIGLAIVLVNLNKKHAHAALNPREALALKIRNLDFCARAFRCPPFWPAHFMAPCIGSIPGIALPVQRARSTDEFHTELSWCRPGAFWKRYGAVLRISRLVSLGP